MRYYIRSALGPPPSHVEKKYTTLTRHAISFAVTLQENPGFVLPLAFTEPPLHTLPPVNLSIFNNIVRIDEVARL
jgi:hypothetical protein